MWMGVIQIFLPFMASSNLTAAQENLSRFSDEINTLHLVVGGERAPFGKDGIACFLGRGKHKLR